MDLQEIKECVEHSYSYFAKNYARFYKAKNFVFNSSITNEEKNNLKNIKTPILEFNALESQISRLRGEFENHAPSVTVQVAEGSPVNAASVELIEFLQGHCKHIISDVATDNLQFQIYSDVLAGGFSVLKIYTDYIHDRSFDQKIFLDKPFDPTMTGFDPLARESHKGDGRYAFEISAYTERDFMEEFGEESLEGIGFKGSSGGSAGSFVWSYQSQGSFPKIIMVIDFYYKARVAKNLFRLADGSILLEEEYNKKLREYEAEFRIEVFPAVVDKRRTYVETIKLARLCENKELGKQKNTNYGYLPLIFVDGNSVMLRENESGPAYQKTREYAYHSTSMQRLKNYAGQAVAKQLQNITMHKMKIAKGSIPKGYEELYRNIQYPGNYVYHQYDENNPEISYNPPQEVMHPPTPPIVETTFTQADKMMQAILGNYDAVLGTNEKNISGKALQSGAIQSSAAANPYYINYIMGFNRALTVIVDLIPKYYKTPRTVPIVDKNGTRTAVAINDPDEPRSAMNYDPRNLDVRVEAGSNTAVEKQITLQLIAQMMSASEAFAAFINRKGLPTIINNMNIKGADQLKLLAEEFIQEQAQAEEEAKSQPDPVQTEAEALIMMEQMKSQMKELQIKADMAMKSAELAVQKQKTDIDLIKALAQINSDATKNAIQQQKADAEESRNAVELLRDTVEEVKTMESIEPKEG